MSYKVVSVVGARPNFIKVAPIHQAFGKYPEIEHLICHTGQHFDATMSDVFFKELSLPDPSFNLGVSGGSHAQQTAKIMLAFEEVLNSSKPDLVLVVGDVNSTLACSLVASKMGIRIAHVEAGLRSFDRSMPEEINRIITDVLSDLLFVTEKSGMENLKKEGKDESTVFFTGNVMIDSLVKLRHLFDLSEVFDKMHLKKGNYILCTFHRPSNVDSKEYLGELLMLLNDLSKKCPVVFPIHPRTRKNMEVWNMNSLAGPNVQISDPIGYVDFLALTSKARLIVTDSGGIQEESTFLGIPCITVRDNTERPVTVEVGTNYLAGRDLAFVRQIAEKALNTNSKTGRIPDLWDGKAAERIAEIIYKQLSQAGTS